MIMDASFNVAMEPFRALVADKLNNSQQTLGFSIQTVLIGIGAVIGSWLPYVLTEWFGFEKTTEAGKIPFSLVVSFIIGAVSLLSCIIWTIIKTPEYSPKEQAEFDGEEDNDAEKGSFLDIFKDFGNMPAIMKQLGLVQFFSWFGLFSMWVFMTPAIAQHIYNLPITDSSSVQYNDAGNWVGVIFGVYNAVSAVYAFFLPKIATKYGRKNTHAYSLIAGGLSLISIYFITDYHWLILPMIGVGFAWASILAMPYVILSGSIPAGKLGIYMGIFNFFITLPQIVNGIFGGFIVKHFYNGQSIYAIVLAGFLLICAAVSVLFVYDAGADKK
jgi:maltose/moltooligosaccharide transporter